MVLGVPILKHFRVFRVFSYLYTNLSLHCGHVPLCDMSVSNPLVTNLLPICIIIYQYFLLWGGFYHIFENRVAVSSMAWEAISEIPYVKHIVVCHFDSHQHATHSTDCMSAHNTIL